MWQRNPILALICAVIIAATAIYSVGGFDSLLQQPVECIDQR